MTAYGTTGSPFTGDVVSQNDFATTDDWARFLGRLYADINGPYYGGEGNLTSVDLRPGYIVNYLFASGIIDGPTLDRIIATNGGDPNGYYAGIINSNPITQKSYNWHKAREFNIEYCEENGCRDPAMQRFYDKWVRSGQPTTKDGMLSDDDFDKYTAVPNEVDGIIEILRNEGYSNAEIQDLLDSIVDNDNFYGSTVLSNILRDLGYYEAGEQWDVSPRPGSPCTDEDGTIGQYDNVGRCVSRGIGSEGDPCGYKGEGKKDATGNCVGGEENCDNPTYAADRVEDCSEFGVCEDGTTLKTDEDGTNCSEYVDPLTDEEKLVRDYGQEAVDKAKEIYNGIEDWVEGTIEDPAGALKNILDTVYSGMPEECKESNTNKPDDWWKDCTNLSVLGQIPGLPIPLPPGTIDVNTTIRDLEDAAKEAGKTLEDIFNPTCTGTPAEIEECENRTISDIIGDWASDVWDDIRSAWEDLEEKTEEGLLNILIDAGYNILSGWIFTQVKDAITLEDPLALFPIENCNNPAWREQATAQEIALCNSAVNCEEQGLTGGYVKDIGECVDPDPNDCAGQDKALKSDGTCGECLDTSKKDFGQGCVDVCEYDESLPADSPECKEPWTDKGPEEQQCTAEGRLHVPGDAATETDSSCGDCLPTHTDEDGTCTEWTDGGATEEECTEQNRVYRPSTGTGRDSSCGGCLEGYEGPECEEIGVEEPCPGNQIRNEETRECEDLGPDFVPGDPCTTEDGKAGTYDSEGGCVPDWVNPGPTVQDCEALGKTHVSGDPSAQKPSECGGCKNSTWNPIGASGECVAPVKCWDDSTAATESECPEEPQLECWDGQIVNDLSKCSEEPQLECWDGQIVNDLSKCSEEPQIECWDGQIVNDLSKCSEEPQIECWDGRIVNDLSKCSEEPLEVDCAAQNKVQDTPYECGGCLPDFNLEGNECVAPPEVVECNAETATKTVNLTETIPFGDPLPDPTTTYEDDGTQCVATTTTYVQGENPCATIDDSNYDECGYDKCPEGSESPYVKDGLECIASVIECTDTNRNTNEDGSCADGCKDGYRLQPGEGGETLCLPPQTVCWDETLAFTESECSEEPQIECWDGQIVNDESKCSEEPQLECWDGQIVNDLSKCSEEPQIECWDGQIVNDLSKCSEEPQIECWDGQIVNDLSKCSEEPPAVNCADANREQADAYTCGPCLADYKEGAEGCVPETCEDNGQTTSLVDGECLDCSGEITRDNFRDCGYKNCGSGVYVPQDQECGYTGVCDDGKEAVSSEGCHVCADNTPKAGLSLSSPEACGEPTTVDPECADGAPRDASGNCPEDYCPDGVTLKDSPGGCPEIVDPLECDEDNLTPETAAACGKQLCNGVYIDKNLPCVPVIPPEGCENGEADFGKGCEQPCPDNANIGISDAACGDTTVTTCLDDTATNFNEEGPCVYGPVVEPECENGAIDYPLCSECPDGGLPDADLGCGGTIDDPCDDPVYAAENPEECTSGPDCVDCTCAEYAAANPEECSPTPPPPEGGGGGGSGEQGERDPFEFGISGDPQLLERMQFPITDYLSGLFTGNR